MGYFKRFLFPNLSFPTPSQPSFLLHFFPKPFYIIRILLSHQILVLVPFVVKVRIIGGAVKAGRAKIGGDEEFCLDEVYFRNRSNSSKYSPSGIDTTTWLLHGIGNGIECSFRQIKVKSDIISLLVTPNE
ncbi:hypothetical protein KI659_17690 [Litoribacter alkaliphilus]|uniref:Uncharacterized protein n=1 Tax=Litoribacter ruber TaxID=702568 RepID=A0AAP2CJH6_9BACT|nr:hypothetical protein [Litoribacter alkaliphilus]MBS9525858.1 hypothetical protein [Litoribacter alkaliphilus]